ncbi:ankyrin repeat domain-containing protein [Methylobacillus glycogenes]|uniref:ankyrin repeat domain-containing protein n=1 Tax=Methylobacillus glycogenes TaxID=406 RepID=UPI000AA3F565
MSRHLIAVLFCSALIATPLSALAAQEQVPYLLTVASKGDVVTVKSLLNSGVNPNTRDADGITALMYATRKDKADVVKALLEKGADVNAKDNGGWTALMFAAKKNFVASAKVLLDHGADAKVRMNLAGAHWAWPLLRVIAKWWGCWWAMV